MKIETFIVDITNGKIGFKSNYHKELFDKYLKQFEGKHRLSIQQVKEGRSEQQHRYYFFYLSLIEQETGNDKEDLHEWAKGKFLSSGITEIFGDKVRKKGSTTTLSKGEFIEYLLKIQEVTGVILPDTTEFYGYSYHT